MENLEEEAILTVGQINEQNYYFLNAVRSEIEIKDKEIKSLKDQLELKNQDSADLISSYRQVNLDKDTRIQFYENDIMKLKVTLKI